MGNDTVSYGFFSGSIDADLQTGVVAFPGNSTLTDTLVGVENVIGAGGNDDITGNSADNILEGGTGNDTLDGSFGNDTLRGQAGNDFLDGGFGFDLIDGGVGNDTVSYEFFSGSIDADLQTGVVAFPGNSTLTDTLVGVENVIGAGGNDDITGNSADNILEGGTGNDTLDGSFGNDTLRGQAGNDTLIGGEGNDQLFGNEGADQFVLTVTGGTDTITDFEIGIDTIVLEGFSFEQLALTQQINGVEISFTETDTVLATVSGVQVSDLSGSFI